MLGFAKIILALALIATTSVWSQVDTDSELHKTILELDGKMFDAYNNCDIETQASLMDEDLEFYHDMAGLATSKQDILTSIEKNICGKVTRTLVEGSVEVHKIEGYGAVELGMHRFFNNQEPDAESKASRFIIIWKQNENNWKISRVISLHKS